MEGVYAKARSEEVAPEMRAAVAKACAGLEVERFLGYLGRDVCVDSSEALGGENSGRRHASGAAASDWCEIYWPLRRFCRSGKVSGR